MALELGSCNPSFDSTRTGFLSGTCHFLADFAPLLSYGDACSIRPSFLGVPLLAFFLPDDDPSGDALLTFNNEVS